MDKVTGAVISGALFVAAGLVYGITTTTGIDASNAPLITTVLGFVGVLVTQAFAAGKARDAAGLARDAAGLAKEAAVRGRDVQDKLTNGYLDETIKRQTGKALDERDGHAERPDV